MIDVGMDDDRVFVTMELLEGDTLRGAIVRRSPDGFSAREAVKLIGVHMTSQPPSTAISHVVSADR